MKQGRFKTNVKLLAEVMSSDLKKGGLATTRAIKNRTAPTFTLPKVLTRDEEAELSSMEIRVKVTSMRRYTVRNNSGNAITVCHFLSFLAIPRLA